MADLRQRLVDLRAPWQSSNPSVNIKPRLGEVRGSLLYTSEGQKGKLEIYEEVIAEGILNTMRPGTVLAV